jgi:hypothetical protein
MNTGCSEKCKMSQEDKQPQNVPGQGQDRMAHKGSLVSDSWWVCKLVQPLWTKIWRLLKNLNIDLPYDPAIPLLGIYPKECDTGYSRGTCTPMFIAVLFTIAKLLNNQDAPLLMNGSRICGTCTQWNFTQP